MQKDKKLILIQLNEINFDYFKDYIFDNNYKNLKQLYKLKYYETYAEKEYKNLEPWIQWFSAVSGLEAGEHKLFRLGDVSEKEIDQIYEVLERKGYKVGAISPMNVRNKLKDPAFFIPDPWTKTNPDNNFWNKKLFGAIKQTVNDNASSKISFNSFLILFVSFLRFFKLKNFFLYFKLILNSKFRPWNKSLFLDLFLHDIHLTYLKKNINFSSIFFNAGAHIQHHYLFNMVEKSTNNPDWYLNKKLNPAKELFDVYDKIVGDYLKLYKENIIVATGLSQELSPKPVYYYRLKNHKSFFKKLGIDFQDILPRMSRDFLMEFNDNESAKQAEKQIQSIEDQSGKRLFEEIDNRGKSLFVSLTYPYEIKNQMILNFNKVEIKMFDEVSFVALKNGIHSPKGYLFTSDNVSSNDKSSFHIKKIFEIINNYF